MTGKIYKIRDWKSIYSLKLTYLKISYYHSLLNKKIKDIVYTFSNIIYLDFEKNIGFTNKAIKLIVESYPDLRYFNISALCNDHLTNHIFRSFYVQLKNDISIFVFIQSCHKLKYLNIFYHIEFTEISICNIIYFYLRL